MSGDKPIAYAIVDERGTIELFEKAITDDYVRGVVGGDYEVIQPTDHDVTLFVDTDGKRKGSTPNWRATRLARSRLRPGDFLVGTVLVTGMPDEDGDVQSLTDEAIADIREDIT